MIHDQLVKHRVSSSDVVPEISVCVANYNGAEYIHECLASVLCQQCVAPFEVIVHDDASSDNSVEIIRCRFPEVTLLTSGNNVGFCISNNRMVEDSRGKYLLLLNNDASLRPGALNAFYERARADERPEILGLPQYSKVDSRLVDRGYEFDIFLNPVPSETKGEREVGAVTGACLWTTRSVWDEIGGFPDWFDSVAEDIFFCQAARLLGYRVMVLDGPGFDHWIGKNLGGGKIINNKLTTTVRRRALSERNKTEAMLICYPVTALLLVIPLHLLFLFIESMFLLITGTKMYKLNSIYMKLPGSIIKNMSKIRMTRKRIQGLRRMTRIGYMRRFRLIPRKFVMLLRYGLPEVKT